ncbi:DNA adenine methylase [Flavobacterium alkalisoli]|uniref:DNA adenine methylase n=1 Tax=Flavobacterium alkalisoli TaxID=2602769 RepID=A0A5B9FVS7_9FLAO|nr:DNA adenine methylase [Flavobacterium alkalisoli]QEE51025.1 DNA adenine methylase [Flavobacterium alkalisoli]
MNEKKKVFTTAPLPFMGQKRRFLKDFKEALKQYPANAVYVDLFGGSGLLSHTVKSVYPDATVVYNDFDNYSDRIKAIPTTNSIMADLRELLDDYPKDKRITGQVKEAVLGRVASEPGYVDYITLSSSLLFSMNYVQSLDELKANTLYNCVRKNDYNASGYLDGLTIVRKDYKELFAQYKDVANVVFLVDPPYLSTEAGTYKNYWKLGDYLDVLDVLKGKPYFYFASNKSSILELCEWVETKTGGENPFKGAEKKEIAMQMNHSATYTDIMLHKQWVTSYSL